MRTPTMAVQAASGRWFAVRYLPTGARYGMTKSLRVDRGDLVEFYDLTHADDSDAFGPLGQFTGGRYFVDTLVAGEGALCLDYGNRDAWTIDAPTMDEVTRWLRATRADVVEEAHAAALRENAWRKRQGVTS